MNEEVEWLLFSRAIAASKWRWRAEVRRLHRTGRATPFLVHIREMQFLYAVWRELRHDAGCGSGDPPKPVYRVFRRWAERKCVAFLREQGLS